MNNTPLSVCHLANYAPPFFGNFMSSLLNLEKKLLSYNNRQIYIFYENSKNTDWIKTMQKEGKTVYFIKFRHITSVFKISKIIKSNNINILHLHFTIPVILCFFLKLFNPKLIILAHLHNLLSGVYGADVYKKKPIARIKKFFYNTFIFDLFCCISRHVKNDMVNCGIRKEKCCHIDNGIDFSRLDKTAEISKEYNNKNVLMIYGTAYYTKGVDIAVSAVIDIVSQYNIILLIVCDNQDFVRKEIIKLLGEFPEWIFLKPCIENIAKYFKNSVLYLSPSREEGFSYTMLESIYCGTPVIRSDIPAMDRGLPHDMVVPVGDAIALREKIEYVLALPESERKSNVAEQKKYIISRWNIDTWSDKVISMYNELL